MVGAIAHATYALFEENFSHARLMMKYSISQIVSPILRDLYSIRRPSLATRLTLAAKYSADLGKWRSQLSRFLDSDWVDTSLMLPLFQRQRNVLNLSYHHALILVHRPFLLSNFASLTNQKSQSRLGPPEIADNVNECLKAALNVTAIINQLSERNQMYRAFWVSLLHIILYSFILLMLQPNLSPPSIIISLYPIFVSIIIPIISSQHLRRIVTLIRSSFLYPFDQSPRSGQFPSRH